MKGKTEKRIPLITDKIKKVECVKGGVAHGVRGECHETVVAGVDGESQGM
jgi:hypothetical protein